MADRRRNAILVQAPPAAMEGIGQTIAALDEPIQDNSLAPKIVPLENVSAGDIEDVLNELFLKKTTQRSYYDYLRSRSREADRDVGRLYGKVRITSEAAANALIITANSQENLDAVIAVVKELDKPSAAGDTTYHIKLNFGNAQKIANRINILFAKNGSAGPAAGQPAKSQWRQSATAATAAAAAEHPRRGRLLAGAGGQGRPLLFLAGRTARRHRPQRQFERQEPPIAR